MKEKRFSGGNISYISENSKNILELNFNKYIKYILEMPEVKEYRSKKKKENNNRVEENLNKTQNNEYFDENKLKKRELPKNKNILKNNFIQSKEEEKNSNSNEYINQYSKNKEDNDVIEFQLNEKLFSNKNFSFSTILKNKIEGKSSENSELVDDVNHDDNNSSNNILNECLNDKNIKNDKVLVNLNDPSEESSSSSYSGTDEYSRSNKKSIFELKEYPYFVLNYCEPTKIQKQTELNLAPESDESLDYDTLNFIKELEKNINDKRLKNAVKLLLNLIFTKNHENTKDIFSNKAKNEFLQYWKKKYLDILEKQRIKTKNNLFYERIQKFDIPISGINKNKLKRFDSCGTVSPKKNFEINKYLLYKNNLQNSQNSNKNNNKISESSVSSQKEKNTVLKSKFRKYKSTDSRGDKCAKKVSFSMKNSENNNVNNIFNSIDGWNDYKNYK